MGGRPYQVNEKDRTTVAALKAVGYGNEDIATYLNLSADTLERHYKKELQTARMEKVREIGQSLMQKAMNGDISAQIFYLKTQGRWKSEDSKMYDNTEEIKLELKKLREKLDAENKREY